VETKERSLSLELFCVFKFCCNVIIFTIIVAAASPINPAFFFLRQFVFVERNHEF